MTLKEHILTYSEHCIGIQFLFIEDGKLWPECAHEIQEGDHLKIYTGKEIVSRCIFDGIIEYDQNYPGIQKGWRPDDWYRLFCNDDGGQYLRAELIKK